MFRRQTSFLVKMLQITLLLVAVSLCHGEGSRYPYPRPGHPDSGYGHRPRRSHQNGNNPADNEPLIIEETSNRPPNQLPNRPSNSPMEVLYSWKQVDFLFQNESDRETMIQNQQFIPKNNLIFDVDIFESETGRKVFVTLPRVRPGVPVTLATVSSRMRNNANLLAPYPNWHTNTALLNKDCDFGITSVFRTHMDDCGRLWVLDSGNNNAFAGATSRLFCPPQVLIYDVRNNDRRIGRFIIPRALIADNSLLVTIAVDTRSQDCSDAFAYIADSMAYKMIVFNLRTREFRRINSILFSPYHDQSTFTVNGVSFDLMGGIFGLALGPLYRGNRRLYFHSIDSVRQSWVDTVDLRKDPVLFGSMNDKPRAFNLFNGSRPSQSAAATMDNNGVMFFGLVASNEIACWNSQYKFSQSNIVKLAKDDATLQFNSGIKVYRNKLYAATNRLQNYITNQIQEGEENYRVLVGDVRSLTSGTSCEVNYLDNRFDTDYTPDSESVDFPSNTN